MTAGYFEQGIMRELFKDDSEFLATLEPLTTSQRLKYALLRLQRLRGELETLKRGNRALREYQQHQEQMTLV